VKRILVLILLLCSTECMSKTTIREEILLDVKRSIDDAYDGSCYEMALMDIMYYLGAKYEKNEAKLRVLIDVQADISCDLIKDHRRYAHATKR
jgi:hypothetical protein